MINRDEGVHHAFTEHSRSCNYRKNKVNIRRRNICPTFLLSLLEASWRFWQRECERTRENVCVWEMRNEKDTYSWELKSMKDTVLIKSSKKKRQNKKKEEREKGEEEVLRNTLRRACMRERARMNRRSMRVKKTKCYERRSWDFVRTFFPTFRL